jgi:hypothetical protein
MMIVIYEAECNAVLAPSCAFLHVVPTQKSDPINSVLELTFLEIDRLVRIPSALPREAARRPLTWTEAGCAAAGLFL